MRALGFGITVSSTVAVLINVLLGPMTQLVGHSSSLSLSIWFLCDRWKLRSLCRGIGRHLFLPSTSVTSRKGSMGAIRAPTTPKEGKTGGSQ